MRAVLWGCRIFIFLFLLAFALKNTEPVSVRFFFDATWQAPLIIIVLAFFAGGAVLGLMALLGTVFGLRREISRLKREVALVKQQQITPS
ncbi:LapA family protein [Propionivibrio soli]|uniref:LapA family protein n=1 Tax=Propionivibrio soli TaxID=2976531 RepID=UPI0021E8AA64|nr:LapA family protein [Propionivibrio soli]